jgi:serine/threonine protein kinase
MLLKDSFQASYIGWLSVKIMKNLLTGLLDIHKRGVMHRDLKPENLMLANKRKFHSVKIIDFGLACETKADFYLYKRCGTPGFVAPEIIAHGKEMD